MVVVRRENQRQIKCHDDSEGLVKPGVMMKAWLKNQRQIKCHGDNEGLVKPGGMIIRAFEIIG